MGGFNLSQIIAPIPGSNDYYELNLTAGTTELSYGLPFTAREITLINDGSSDINFAMNGNSASPASQNFGTLYDDNSPQWTYNGSWTVSTTWHNYGTQSEYSSDTSSSAVFKPPGTIQSITWATLTSSGSGTAKIELSQDGGITWVNPSSISGVTRLDGTVGTALDTYNLTDSSSGTYKNITYNFPNAGSWAMRITPTVATKLVFVDAGFASATPIYSGGRMITVKTGESFSLQLQTTKVNLYSATASQACRVIARS